MLALLNGCAEPRADNYVLVKKGPPPEIVAVDGKAKLIPAGFIKRRLRLGYPTLKDNIIIGDRQYLYITEKWFMDVVEWSEYFIKLQVPELDSLPDRPTAYEETLTILMSNLANVSVSKRYNVKASVLIGLVVAKSDNPWGKLPADGKPRQYVIGLTEHGSVIYDIPTRQIIDGNDFPNKESMIGIMF
jgi:hypothetical protein